MNLMECFNPKSLTEPMASDKTPLNLYEMFSTNKDSEDNGVWLNLTDTTSFKIRFAGAKEVSDLREKLLKPYQTLMRVGGQIPDDKSEEIALRVVAGAVLVDWKGVKLPVDVTDNQTVVDAIAAIPEGKLVADENGCHAFNPDAAFALLKCIPRMVGVVSGYATDSQNFKDAAKEDGAGN